MLLVLISFMTGWALSRFAIFGDFGATFKTITGKKFPLNKEEGGVSINPHQPIEQVERQLDEEFGRLKQHILSEIIEHQKECPGHD